MGASDFRADRASTSQQLQTINCPRRRRLAYRHATRAALSLRDWAAGDQPSAASAFCLSLFATSQRTASCRVARGVSTTPLRDGGMDTALERATTATLRRPVQTHYGSGTVTDMTLKRTEPICRTRRDSRPARSPDFAAFPWCCTLQCRPDRFGRTPPPPPAGGSNTDGWSDSAKPRGTSIFWTPRSLNIRGTTTQGELGAGPARVGSFPEHTERARTIMPATRAEHRDCWAPTASLQLGPLRLVTVATLKV